MRITHEILLHLSTDSDQVQTLFKRTETVSRLTIDTYAKHAGHAFVVTDTETEALSLGDITTAKGVYLEVDGPCSIYLSGSSDPIVMRPSGTSALAKMFLECDIVSIDVEASEGEDVSGIFVVWGD